MNNGVMFFSYFLSSDCVDRHYFLFNYLSSNYKNYCVLFIIGNIFVLPKITLKDTNRPNYFIYSF